MINTERKSSDQLGVTSFIVFGLTIFSLLMFYNSCGKMKGSGPGMTAASQCVSKPQLVRKMDLDFKSRQAYLKSTPGLYDLKKVWLDGLTTGTPVESSSLSKVQTQDSAALPAGVKLTVLIDNDCLKEKLSKGETESFAASVLAGSKIQPFLKLHSYDYDLPEATTLAALNEKVENDSCVKGLAQNFEYELASFPAESGSRPSDPFVSRQKHLDDLEALEAYSEFYHPEYGMNPDGGADVVVAVIDTGLDRTHSEFESQVRAVYDGDQVFYGVDATSLHLDFTDYNPIDESADGHGTGVSGLIAARTNNSVGVAGAAPFRVKVLPVKVLTPTVSNTTHLVNGIRWAADAGVHVINISLQIRNPSTVDDTALREVIEYAINAGSFIVVAAGNSSEQLSNAQAMTTVIPAKYSKDLPGMLTVGSIDVGSGQRSSFSYWNPDLVQIGAPGNQANGTDVSPGLFTTRSLATGNLTGFDHHQGTSFASPLVSAAAALTIGLIRENYGQIPNGLEIERLILKSAARDSQLAGFFEEGRKLNLKNLVAAIQEDYPATKGEVDQPDGEFLDCP